MGVSGSKAGTVVGEAKGASARTRRLMLKTAIDLMQRGETPSVSVAA